MDSFEKWCRRNEGTLALIRTITTGVAAMVLIVTLLG